MASTLESLPLDVRDHLLCVLPDFASLRSAVLSCKAFHGVYILRKKSIVDEVAKNEAGPAMRYAVAVTRGMIDLADAKENGGWSRLRLGIEGDGDNEGEYWNEEVRFEDINGWKLLKVVSSAEALEKEYSLRYVTTLSEKISFVLISESDTKIGQ